MKKIILILMLAVTAVFAQGQITFNTQVSNINGCGGTYGSVSVMRVMGGVAPYLYSKDGGSHYQASTLFGNLITGNYSIVVKDHTGVTATHNVSVGVNAPVRFTYSVLNCSDCNTANGAISILGSGGAGYYSYSITNGVSWQSNNNFMGLGNGSYSIMVKDVMGCVSGVVNVVVGCN